MKSLNYYEVLGINHSATADEIRRAYRILARRYHPDLNPGRPSEERFKLIALAYQTLSDVEKKRAYDGEIDSAKRIRAGFAAYERAQNQASHSKRPRPAARPQQPSKVAPRKDTSANPLDGLLAGVRKIVAGFTRHSPKSSVENEVNVREVSVVEVSISMQDALFGGRKSIEIPGGAKGKKISLRIPSGVRSGSVLRVQSGTRTREDYVIILRVAPHPLLEFSQKGIVVDLPVSLNEAIYGATVKVPGLEEELTLVIPPGSQSGQEIRITNQGVKFEDGRRGDIFYRLNIEVPVSYQAVGLKEKIDALSEYYERPARQGFPKILKGSA